MSGQPKPMWRVVFNPSTLDFVLACEDISEPQKNYLRNKLNIGASSEQNASDGLILPLTEKTLGVLLPALKIMHHGFEGALDTAEAARLYLATVGYKRTGETITFELVDAAQNTKIAQALKTLGVKRGTDSDGKIFISGEQNCTTFEQSIGINKEDSVFVFAGTCEENAMTISGDFTAEPEPTPLPPTVTSAGRDESGFSSLRVMRNVVKTAIDFLIGVADRILGIHIRP